MWSAGDAEARELRARLSPRQPYKETDLVRLNEPLYFKRVQFREGRDIETTQRPDPAARAKKALQKPKNIYGMMLAEVSGGVGEGGEGEDGL